MEIKTNIFKSENAAGEPVPTVIAKKRKLADAPLAGLGTPNKDEQNASEIARLSSWATGDCGTPILPD